jgi:hypothetical protein
MTVLNMVGTVQLYSHTHTAISGRLFLLLDDARPAIYPITNDSFRTSAVAMLLPDRYNDVLKI